MSELNLEKNITADIHLHSEHSHDSVCHIADMKAAAKEKGIDIICIADHCDIEYCDEIDVEKIITDSIADSKYHNQDDGIQVLSGVEIGETFWNTKLAEKVVKLEGLDQIIGSVHAVRYDGYTQPYSLIDFSEFTRAEVEKYIDIYFDDVLERIKTTEFDILAHLTCPLRYINGKYGRAIDCHMYEHKIKAILEEIIQRKIALEVNTSNCGSSYDEFMPEEWIVKMYKEMGGQLITFGSDAHIAENVGHQFSRLREMLIKYGFSYACYFKNRCIHKYLI